MLLIYNRKRVIVKSAYWKNKTIKRDRRKARKQQTLYYAGLLGRASKIGSALYARLPLRYKRRGLFLYLTGLALQLLKKQISEEAILTQLLATLPPVAHRADEVKTLCESRTIKKKAATLSIQQRQYYFITTRHQRFCASPITALFKVRFRSTKAWSFNDT
jgi:hypothetical protein